MHTRIVSFTDAKDIDGGVTYLRDKVIPMLSQAQGYRGATASADRHHAVFAVLSLWDTAEARDATEGALQTARTEALDIVGGELHVELYEQFVAEIGQRPPAPGASLMVTPVRMDPAKVDEDNRYFKEQVLPEIKATPGFLAVRAMGDRVTGKGLVGTSWADDEAMQRAAQDAQKRRENATGRGITFGDVSFREILYVDLK